MSILYAAVALGPTPLADLIPAAADPADSDGAGDDDLRALAARCLAAAPPFHRLYTHTAAGRTHAFLIDDTLTLFAIADDALPRPDVLLFLRRLRDAAAPFSRSRAVPSQDDLLPVLRHLLLSPDKPPPPPPGPPAPAAPPPSPPSDAPLTAETPSGSEDGLPRKGKTWRKKLWSDGSDSRMEIPPDSVRNVDRGTAHKLWRRHVWRILLLDLIICCILFVIWLSVCRGFQCIQS